MAKAGATHVVVLERAHPETVKMVVKAGRNFGLKAMGEIWRAAGGPRRSPHHSNAFCAAGGELESKLRLVCEKVHAYGDVATGSPGTKN
jgi:hypothetical protein